MTIPRLLARIRGRNGPEDWYPSGHCCVWQTQLPASQRICSLIHVSGKCIWYARVQHIGIVLWGTKWSLVWAERDTVSRDHQWSPESAEHNPTRLHLAVRGKIKHKNYQCEHVTQSPFTQLAMTAQCLRPDGTAVTPSTDTLPVLTWIQNEGFINNMKKAHISADGPGGQISHLISCWVNEPAHLQISSMASFLWRRHFSNYAQGLNWD